MLGFNHCLAISGKLKHDNFLRSDEMNAVELCGAFFAGPGDMGGGDADRIRWLTFRPSLRDTDEVTISPSPRTVQYKFGVCGRCAVTVSLSKTLNIRHRQPMSQNSNLRIYTSS